MLTLDAAQGLIRTAVGHKVLGNTLDADTRFDDIGLSSLDMTEVIFAIEDHLHIEISEDARPQTVGELIDVANRAATPLASSST